VKERSWQELGTRLADPQTHALVDVDPDLLDASEPMVMTRGSELAHYAKCIGLSMAIAAGAILTVAIGSAGIKQLARPSGPATAAPYQAVQPATTGKGELRGQAARPQAKEQPAAESAQPPVTAPVIQRPTKEQASAPAERGVDAEVALLRRATSVQKQDPAAALALLDRHARDFPDGPFADVREVHRAEILCALGRREEAREVASKFLRKYPGSHSTSRMRRICSEDGRQE